MQQRTGDRDTCIVDETKQAALAERGFDLRGARFHRGFIGDVEQERRHRAAEFFGQAVGVGLFAHRAEHVGAFAHGFRDRGASDACGGAGDDDRAVERGHYLNL